MKMVRSNHTVDDFDECEFLERMMMDTLFAWSNENAQAVTEGYAKIRIPAHLVGKPYTLHQLYAQSPAAFSQAAGLVLAIPTASAAKIMRELKLAVLDHDQSIRLWARYGRPKEKKGK
jgi:hypothetical protein